MSKVIASAVYRDFYDCPSLRQECETFIPISDALANELFDAGWEGNEERTSALASSLGLAGNLTYQLVDVDGDSKGQLFIYEFYDEGVV